MKENFDKCFDLVVGSEGTYDDDPDDKGNWTGGKIGEGELRGTKFGIDAAAHPTVDIKRLSKDGAKEIYLRDYWGYRCDQLPSGLDYIYFDMCVNNGKSAATKMMQRGLGITADGLWGPNTQSALEAADPSQLIESVSKYRESYYHSLNMFWKYGRGWLNRVARVKRDALAMA